MQSHRAQFAAQIKVERGPHDVYAGPSPAEIASWAALEYKPFDGSDSFSSHTGFYAHSIGAHMFIALWEYLSEKKNVIPEVDPNYWKMTFEIKEPMEDIDSEGEEDFEIPT